MKTNILKVVNNNLCIGCGFCKAACRDGAISIVQNKYKEIIPEVDNEKCTGCELCLKVCPMEVVSLTSKINRAIKLGSEFGLNASHSSWVGHQKNNEEEYINSSSGGILSALLCKLFENKEIDAVIHAKQLFGSNNSSYFKSHISYDIDSVNSNRSSFYSPIEFSGLIGDILANDKIKSLVFVGTPCVISAVYNLGNINKKFRDKIKYTFALVCGHNVSGQFADHISNSLSNDINLKRKLKFRDKEGISEAGDFNNSVEYQDGTKKLISRHLSPYTLYWRMNAYGLNGCNYCPDFLGEKADASFKDAWGLQLVRKEGETAYRIRNNRLKEILTQMEKENLISTRTISNKQFATSQEGTYYDKVDYIEARARKHPALKKGIKKKLKLIDRSLLLFVFRIKKTVQNKSKKKYLKGKIYPARKLKLLSFFVEYLQKFVLIRRKFKVKRKPYPEVLYTAGFGYRNIGDEAQLHTNLQLWKKLAPEYKITILSPRPDYTRAVHGNYDVIPASRVSFFGINGFDYFGIGEKKLFYPYYWLRLQLIWINAIFVKLFGRAPFIGTDSAILLKRLKKADLFHLGGGGVLTGKTRSRMYDFTFLVRLSAFFNTEVILTGHNIGIWENFRQKNALKRLKRARYIGLRDNSGSVDALKKIGIYQQDKVFPLFDDALFCEGMDKDLLFKHLESQGLNMEKKYIAINCYSTPKIEKEVKEAINSIASHLNEIKNKYNFVIISTHPLDDKVNYYLKSRLPEAIILSHNDSTPMVVSCFQNADMCLTIRHHPIIFSMSGAVPTMAITFDPYYELKNRGALDLFSQGDMVLSYDKEKFENDLSKLLKHTISNRDEISSVIERHFSEFKKKEGLIIKNYLESR